MFFTLCPPTPQKRLLLKSLPLLLHMLNRLNCGAFFTFSTLERILLCSPLCWLILLHRSKLRWCHKRAATFWSKGGREKKNANRRFHARLWGVNGRKCSQLRVCLRRLIIIAVLLLRSPCSRCALCRIPFGGRWTGCLGVHMRKKSRCLRRDAHKESLFTLSIYHPTGGFSSWT